jgi:ribulose-5-phosphate 4-epimerase/fuculose-1-phosphate aldolase
MNRPKAAVSAHVPREIREAEWKTRVDLAACYRLVALFGMSDLVYNHITAKIPGVANHILINPFGLMYEEITASSLLKIDLDGNILDGGNGQYDFNRAGYAIHSAVHSARPEIQCVLHTHSRAGTVLSALKCGLLPITQRAMRFAHIGYHDYESVVLATDAPGRLVRDLGTGEAVILRNHGLLTVGTSVGQAFNLMYWLENACQVQIDAMSTGAELIRPSPEIVERTSRLFQPKARAFRTEDGSMRWFGGDLEWPAMLRYLDRRDDSYKT